jgi:hypothetical protein
MTRRSVKKYYSQDVLAQSLCEDFYSNNSGFLPSVRDSGLPSEELTDSKRAWVDARQELYRLLAAEAWSPMVSGSEATPGAK